MSLAAIIEQVREEGYQRAISDLRYLADARDRYRSADVEPQVVVARHLADLLEGSDDGAGWLPSWMWDEWEKRAALHAPALRVRSLLTGIEYFIAATVLHGDEPVWVLVGPVPEITTTVRLNSTTFDYWEFAC